MPRSFRTVCSALLSVLLTAILVCACALPGFAVSGETLTPAEKTTERLIADVLKQQPLAARALKQENAYAAFLDTVAAQQKTLVAQENARTRALLQEHGISPSTTVGELKERDDAFAQKLFRDIRVWLVDADEDSSVLAYSRFPTVRSIADLPLSELIGWNSLQDFVDTWVPLLLKDALDALRALGLLPEEDPAWPLLDRQKIVDYAHKYAKKYNPAYRVPETGSDCTNFVSQCLYAGGLSMQPSSYRGTNPGITTTTEEWYYYNVPSAAADAPYGKAVGVSTSWIRVEDLYTYLAPHFEVFTSSNTKKVAQNLQEGYVIQGGPAMGRYEHSSIVTVKNGKFCYTAHTNDRKDRAMKHYYNAYDKFRVLKVC